MSKRRTPHDPDQQTLFDLPELPPAPEKPKKERKRKQRPIVPKEFDNEEPLARNSHPDTSLIAAMKLTLSGKRSKWKHRLLVWLLNNNITTPGASMTARELAAVSQLPHTAWHKRLPDLRRDGWVANSHQKVCGVTGNTAWTWIVTERKET